MISSEDAHVLLRGWEEANTVLRVFFADPSMMTASGPFVVAEAFPLLLRLEGPEHVRLGFGLKDAASVDTQNRPLIDT